MYVYVWLIHFAVHLKLTQQHNIVNEQHTNKN